VARNTRIGTSLRAERPPFCRCSSVTMNEHCFLLASRIRDRCAPNSGTNSGVTRH
jgi:hypothetical protein